MRAEQEGTTHDTSKGIPGVTVSGEFHESIPRAEDRQGGEPDRSPGAPCEAGKFPGAGDSDAQPCGARPVSGPPAGAATRQLPDALPHPSPQRGSHTEHVLFINDALVEKLVKEQGSREELWPYGPVIVKTWKYGEDLVLAYGQAGPDPPRTSMSLQLLD